MTLELIITTLVVVNPMVDDVVAITITTDDDDVISGVLLSIKIGMLLFNGNSEVNVTLLVGIAVTADTELVTLDVMSTLVVFVTLTDEVLSTLAVVVTLIDEVLFMLTVGEIVLAVISN